MGGQNEFNPITHLLEINKKISDTQVLNESKLMDFELKDAKGTFQGNKRSKFDIRGSFIPS